VTGACTPVGCDRPAGGEGHGTARVFAPDRLLGRQQAKAWGPAACWAACAAGAGLRARGQIAGRHELAGLARHSLTPCKPLWAVASARGAGRQPTKTTSKARPSSSCEWLEGHLDAVAAGSPEGEGDARCLYPGVWDRSLIDPVLLMVQMFFRPGNGGCGDGAAWQTIGVLLYVLVSGAIPNLPSLNSLFNRKALWSALRWSPARPSLPAMRPPRHLVWDYRHR